MFQWVPRQEDGSLATMAGFAIPMKGLFVWVKDVDIIEKVMTDKKTFPTRGDTGFSAWVPEGLLALPTGPKWQLHRRLVSRFLSTEHLRNYGKTIEEKTEELLALWRTAAETAEPQDVQGQLSRTTLDVISVVAFGVNSGIQTTDDQIRLAEAADTILNESALRTTEAPIMPYITPGRQKRFQEAVQWVRQMLFSNHVIQGDADTQKNIISMLRSVQKSGDEEITDEEIIQEVMTIGGAGHETTANTISWALLLLAHNPLEQVRLQHEADLKVAGNCATFDESQNLEATLCAIYETLRLYPTVPAFPRESAVDCVLGGYDIPRGSRVIVSLMQVNRNPKWYPEPDEFRPSRFAGVGPPKPSQPVGVPGAPEFAFLPFGAGSRTCVGQRLAVLEAVQILSAVMKAFTVRLPENAPTVFEHSSITLRPKGMRLVFEKRS